MKYPILFVIISFFAVFSVPSGLVAQYRTNFCDHAQTTADTLDCINKHKEKTQKELNTLYKELAELQQPEDSESTLGQSQQAWINYRDTQCHWESGWAGSSGLEQIYESSCIAYLTQQRNKLFKTMIKREKEGTPREFATHPRWMNVLASDYPDIYWRYGQWVSTDLNCDGIKEEIMTGLVLQNENGDEDTERKERRRFFTEAVIAVSDNVSAGRPKPHLLPLPVSRKQAEHDQYCGMPEDLILLEDDGDNESKDEKQHCETVLQITDRICPPVFLSWRDGSYYLSHKRELTENPDTKSNPEKK